MSDQSARETKKTLRYLQVAAIGALILIGSVIYTFVSVSSTSGRSFPDVTIPETLRQPLPQFEWSNGKNQLKSSDLQGSWTLLSFWAYSCAPCVLELPDLDRLNANWTGPEFSILTINIDDNNPETMQTVKEFIASNDLQLPVYYDTDGILKKAFGVQEIPRHFLVDPNGMIVWQAMGAFKWTSPETQKNLIAIMGRDQAPIPDVDEPQEEL